MATLKYLKSAFSFFSVYDFLSVLTAADNVFEQIAHNDAARPNVHRLVVVFF
jgi:hypothetical protein